MWRFVTNRSGRKESLVRKQQVRKHDADQAVRKHKVQKNHNVESAEIWRSFDTMQPLFKINKTDSHKC